MTELERSWLKTFIAEYEDNIEISGVRIVSEDAEILFKILESCT